MNPQLTSFFLGTDFRDCNGLGSHGMGSANPGEDVNPGYEILCHGRLSELMKVSADARIGQAGASWSLLKFPASSSPASQMTLQSHEFGNHIHG